MRLPAIIAVLAVQLACVAPAGAQLKIGDPAPALTLTEWLKGGPVDLAAGKGKKIFVLDFWATWCPPCIQDIPHLTKMQKAYAASGVEVISVTSPGLDQRQSLAQVKRFMADHGSKMGYTVAWDQASKMDVNYLVAAGAPGLPHAFVIDKSGRIAWQGHPQAGIEDVIDGLLAGSYDVDKQAARARNEAELGQLLFRFQTAMRAGGFKQGIAVLNEALVLDPAHFGILATLQEVYVRDLRDLAGYRAWVQKFMDEHRADSEALTVLVQVLLGIEAPGDRLPELMLAAAQQAFASGGGKDAAAIEVYARVAHRVGNLEEAIRLQALAVDAAPEHRKADLTRSLEYYRTCRQLGDRQF